MCPHEGPHDRLPLHSARGSPVCSIIPVLPILLSLPLIRCTLRFRGRGLPIRRAFSRRFARSASTRTHVRMHAYIRVIKEPRSKDVTAATRVAPGDPTHVRIVALHAVCGRLTAKGKKKIKRRKRRKRVRGEVSRLVIRDMREIVLAKRTGEHR